MSELLGEWSDNIQAFWIGGMGVEYIAWKGSHQIFVYPCDQHPNPPSEIIQHDTRIETLEEFNRAFKEGKRMKVKYKKVAK